MANQDDASGQPSRDLLENVKQFLVTSSTVAAILALLLSPIVPLFVGFTVDRERLTWWILIAIVLLGAAVLITTGLKARALKAYRDDRALPTPQRLWQIWLQVISHKQELLPPPLCVAFVHPAQGETLARLRKSENLSGKIPATDPIAGGFAFHYLPKAEENEDDGTDALGRQQTLEAVEDLLRGSSGVVILDDPGWKAYPHTSAVIREWARENSGKPIIAIRAYNRGDWFFNGIDVSDLQVGQATASRTLLVQSLNRSDAWQGLARGTRRHLGLATVAILILTLGLFAVGLRSWQQHATLTKLRADTRLLQRVGSIVPGELTEIARAQRRLRLADRSEPSAVRALVEAYLALYLNRLAIASPSPEQQGRYALAFAIRRSPDVDSLHEVASFGRQLRTRPFAASLRSNQVKGIAPCAARLRAPVLWRGDSERGTTTQLRAWGWDGKPLADGDVSPEIFRADTITCTYVRIDADEPRTALLCAPVGHGIGDADLTPMGVICVSAQDSASVLSVEWSRQLLLRVSAATASYDWGRLVTPAEPILRALPQSASRQE